MANSTACADCGKRYVVEDGHCCWQTVGRRVPEGEREEWTTCSRCHAHYNCANGHTCVVRVEPRDTGSRGAIVRSRREGGPLRDEAELVRIAKLRGLRGL